MEKSNNLSLRILKLLGTTMATILVLLIILPLLFTDTITEKVKVLANESLEGELNFHGSSLSFFSNFPSLTATFEDFSLNGSAPFQNEKLVVAENIGFGIDVISLIFGKNIEIDKIFLDEANIDIRIDEKGEANYNVYTSKDTKALKGDRSASLQLKSIQINNSHLLYKDASTKMLLEANGFDYRGKGNLLDADFKLETSAKVDSLTFSYESIEYLKNKNVKANLITKINTHSLAFIFEKNDLTVNKLPVEFSGHFNFLSNGYSMDFDLKTENSSLQNLFAALPPEYVNWMNDTELKGKIDAHLTLKGAYIASKNLNPEVDFKIRVRDGSVKNKKSPYLLEDIYLNLETKLPDLDLNRLHIKLDSLYFKLDNNRLSAILISDGLGDKMRIDAKARSKMDLKVLSDALRIPNFKIAGVVDADIVSKGTYDSGAKKFPLTKGFLQLSNGAVQSAYYPKPIEKINVNATLNCSGDNFSDASLILDTANFSFENEPFNATASFTDFDDVLYDIKVKGRLDIGHIHKVFSQEGSAVDGFINADLSLKGRQSDATNGNYQKLKNSGTLEVVNIETTSDYLPKPFLIESGLFTFDQDRMTFEDFKGRYGQSDMVMSGYLENAINFVLSDNEIIKGNFALSSQSMNIGEFIPVNTSVPSPITTSRIKGVFEIPDYIDISVRAKVIETIYEDISIEDLQGDLSIKNGSLNLDNASLGIIGATAKMSALYKNEGAEKAYFDYNIKADDFDIARAYNEINIFKEIVPAAEYAQGTVSIDYHLKGVLNKQMEPVLPSLEGSGVLSVKKVKMKGLKILNQVAKKTESTAINDPDISKVDIKSAIKNNILTIERFRFKVSGFRLRFEGESSLDGKLNLKMRVGLPPLGIIGIPIKITGTHDDPDIKLGRRSKDLEETEYVDGVSPLTDPADSSGVSLPTIQKNSLLRSNTVPLNKEKDTLPVHSVPNDSTRKDPPKEIDGKLKDQ